jgi:hypothetical protein
MVDAKGVSYLKLHQIFCRGVLFYKQRLVFHQINLLPGMPGVVGAARRIPASHFSRAAPKRNRLFSIAVSET